MSRSASAPVHLEGLEIRQFKGVQPQKAFVLDSFSPGINILYGPNGCGKSTTATAIQQLLWPVPVREYRDLNARVRQGDSQWILQDRGDRVDALRDGATLPHPVWAAAETRSRYHWSLQNLLQDQDRELARSIAREMAGGIDFQELAASLNWQKKPAAPGKLHQQYREAERGVREAREKQQDILRESETRSQLERMLEEALRELSREKVLRSALEWQEKKGEWEQLQQKLAEAPPGMAQLRADDAETLQSLRRRLRELEENSAALQEKRKALGPGEEEWAVFDADAFRSARKQMQEYLERIRDLQDQLDTAEREVQQAETREQDLRSRLGLQTQASLQLEEGYVFPELTQWIQLILTEKEWQARVELLKTQLPEQDEPLSLPDPELLREARQLLDNWQRIQGPPPLRTQAGFIAAMLLLAGGILWLAASARLSWLALTVLVPPLLLQAWSLRQKRATAAREIEERYQEMTVPQPAAWEESQVKQTLRALEEALRSAHTESRLEIDRRRLAEAGSAHTEVREKIRTLQTDLSARGFEAPADPVFLAHFLENVQRWRNCRSETAVAESARDHLERQCSETAEKLRRLLGNWGLHCGDLSLKTVTESALERMERELERRRQMEVLDLQRKQTAENLSDLQEELKKFADRTGLEDPSVAELQQRVEFLEAWKQLLRKSEILSSRISELEALLEGHPSLLEQSSGALELQLNRCREAREQEVDLRDRISKLDQKISDQQQGRRLHEAHESLAEIREALQSERDDHLQTRLGMEILDWLQDRCKTRDQSEALAEANRCLVLFSSGTLKLEVAIGDKEGGFRACREGGNALPLDLLSSGERSQVLMAVRLAFLHQVEQAPLPLLVDEALGIMDDQRGSEILQALIEVSRQGRQIFYFTAQQDEVDKWRTALETGGVRARFIDLAAERGWAEHRQLPPIPSTPESVTDYGRRPEESLADWAARLRIPGWEPHQPLEQLSLWPLLYDRPALLQTLFSQGIDRVGKWQLFDETGANRRWTSEAEREDLNRTLRLLAEAQKLWQIGRPPPLPGSVIADSSAVSETFRDAVQLLLSDCGGDARQLIARLDQGEVKGFRQNKIRELEQEIRDRDYLSDLSPLPADRIQAQLLADDGNPLPDSFDWEKIRSLFFPAHN
ncbi:MAG: AAA family ATPase [Kiritimatiellia bacterium]